MTTTPAIWKSTFTANSGSTAGSQSAPQTIGLANGNILVVWEDDTEPTRPFTDVIGQLYDAQGNTLGGVFQVNQAIWGSDETGPQIVAMPDGGFVMAYGSYFEALGGILVVERFNAAGQSIFNNVITDPLSSLTDWSLTADSFGNFTVGFERLVEGLIQPPPPPQFPQTAVSIDVHTITYDNTNVRGPEQTNVAQNSTGRDRLGAVAAFDDGRIVTFYTEPDSYHLAGTFLPPLYVSAMTFEFTITDPLSGATVRGPTEIADPETRLQGRAQDVVVLEGGQIVLLYGILRGDGELAMRIVANGSSNGSIASEIVVDNSFSLAGDGMQGFANAHAVALLDGGFMVAWTVDNFLYAQRFNAAGGSVGTKLIVDQQVKQGQTALFELSLTSDGRVLVPFVRDTGEIGEVILDPRSNVIFGTNANEVLTTQIGSTVIDGGGGSDTILGQAGNDFINGGTGIDTLHGGNGNDTFYLFDTTGAGDHDVVIEAVNAGIDTVRVRPGSDPNILYYYTLAANVENGVVDSAETFDLIGNALGNQLGGGAGGNFLFGLNGNDVLDGGGGNDNLYGGVNNDTLIGGTGGDVLDGGTETDSASYVTSASLVRTSLDSSVVKFGDALGDTYFNIENLTGSSFNDTLGGDGNANAINGNHGIDLISGGGGDDNLLGGEGDDTLNGGTENDTLNGQNGVDRLNGDAGNDNILGGNGDDIIRGGTNDDVLDGQGSNDNIRGDSGNDTIYGSGGNDALFGDAGTDMLSGGTGVDLLDGGTGNDTLTGLADGSRDTFVFRLTYGLDRINGFEQLGAGTDRLQLDDNLWLASQGVLTAAQVVATFGSVNASNTLITLNFGGGNVLEVQNGIAAGGLNLALLGSDILIV